MFQYTKQIQRHNNTSLLKIFMLDKDEILWLIVRKLGFRGKIMISVENENYRKHDTVQTT